jgi:hypothetical protein
VKVVANERRLLDGPGGQMFRIPQLNSLWIRFATPQLVAGGPTWVTLTLQTPYGGTYQIHHIPYSNDPALKTTPSRYGVSAPADVIQAMQTSSGHGLDAEIHVAGTNLARQPQPGLWRFIAAADDIPEMKAEAVVELGVMQ